MKSFSTPSVIFKVDQVDEQSGILSKVLIAQTGEVKSHYEIIDQITLEQIQQLGNAKEKGVKARFGHPNMCTTSFGTYIGRFKNFQVEDNSAYADLYLDSVCKDSPSGNLYNYILSMAINNPDMFGASIAFTPGKSDVKEGHDYPLTRITELLATDLVDDPAATNSLFAVDSFSYQATTFLDANPAIAMLIAKNPETIVEFMLKYYTNNDFMKKEMFQKLRNLFTGNTDNNQNAQREVNQLEKQFDDMTGHMGESFAGIVESLRNSTTQPKKFEGFETAPEGSIAILDKLEVREELTIENMFDDMRTIIYGQESQTSNLITYYNSIIEKLQQDHQTALSEVQQQISTYQSQVTSLSEQVTNLQDQLKAAPTQVEGIDPQIHVGPTEETFGKKLLKEMPTQLKDKIKK